MFEINLCQFAYKNKSVIHSCDKVVICASEYTRINTLKGFLDWVRNQQLKWWHEIMNLGHIHSCRPCYPPHDANSGVKGIFKFTTIVRVCLHIVLVFWEKPSPPPFTPPVWLSDEMSLTACWAVDLWLMLLLVGLEIKSPIHCNQELFVCFVPAPKSKCRSAVFRCLLITWWSRCSHYVEENTQGKEAFLCLIVKTQSVHMYVWTNLVLCTRACLAYFCVSVYMSIHPSIF